MVQSSYSSLKWTTHLEVAVQTKINHSKHRQHQSHLPRPLPQKMEIRQTLLGHESRPPQVRGDFRQIQ